VDLYLIEGTMESDWYVIDENYDFKHPLEKQLEVNIPLGENALENMPADIRNLVNTDTYKYDFVWFSYSDVTGAYENVRVMDTREVVKYQSNPPRNYPKTDVQTICMPTLDEVMGVQQREWKSVTDTSTVPTRSTVYFCVRIPKPFTANWEYDEGTVESQIRYGQEMHAVNGNATREHYEFDGWDMVLMNKATGEPVTAVSFTQDEINEISWDDIRQLVNTQSDSENIMPACDVRMVPKFSPEKVKAYFVYNGLHEVEALYGEPLLAFDPIGFVDGRRLEWYSDYSAYLNANKDYLIADNDLTDIAPYTLYGRIPPYTITYLDGETGEVVKTEQCYSSEFNPSNNVGRFWPIEVPARAGYDAQWLLDGEPLKYINDSTFYGVAMPEHDITLVSSYTMHTYSYRWVESIWNAKEVTVAAETPHVSVGSTVGDIRPGSITDESDNPRYYKETYRLDETGQYRTLSAPYWKSSNWVRVTDNDPLPANDATFYSLLYPRYVNVTWKLKNSDYTVSVWVGDLLKPPTSTYEPGFIITGWHDADGNTYEYPPAHDITLYPDVIEHEHTWDNGTVYRAAYCDQEGLMVYRCTDCGKTREEIIPKTEHDYQFEDSTNATCTEPGVIIYKCTVCRNTYEEVWQEALGHDTVEHGAQQPTCTEVGWDSYVTCTRCDYSTRVEIPALGHDLSHFDAKEPNCEEAGWEAYDKCSRCTYSTRVDLPALGHDFIHHDAKAATCTEIGWDDYDNEGYWDEPGGDDYWDEPGGGW